MAPGFVRSKSALLNGSL